MSVLGNAKSHRHRKMYPVEPGGTGRKYMFLLGETWQARARQETAEAIVAKTPGESRDERRAEASRKSHSLHPIWRAGRRAKRPRRWNYGNYLDGEPNRAGGFPPGEARAHPVIRDREHRCQKRFNEQHGRDQDSLYRGRSRAKLAGLNRRMRRTACLVVWEG